MVDPETGSVILAGSSAGCQANRPGIPASIWAGLIGWQAVRASLVTHAAPMGAAKGLLALRSGPVMVADGRAGEVAAISLALGPVPHPATPKIENQDLGPAAVAMLTELAGVAGTGPAYLAPDKQHALK